MGGNGNRADLSEFLRSRRERIRPAQVGLPGGPRRRAPGLRREEIALLAGVSPTWYTYLEQGRAIRPSPEVLESLARVLRLTPDERRYLYLLVSGQAPPTAKREVAPTGIGQVVDAVGVGDLPVYAGNIYGDVTFWNAATTKWYTDFTALPEGRRNMLWWLLTDPSARDLFADWAEETKEVLARFRLASVMRPADPRFRELIAALRETSGEFRTWWASYEISGQDNWLRRLVQPDGSVHAFELVVLRMADDVNSVVLHVPVADPD